MNVGYAVGEPSVNSDTGTLGPAHDDHAQQFASCEYNVLLSSAASGVGAAVGVAGVVVIWLNGHGS